MKYSLATERDLHVVLGGQGAGFLGNVGGDDGSRAISGLYLFVQREGSEEARDLSLVSEALYINKHLFGVELNHQVEQLLWPSKNLSWLIGVIPFGDGDACTASGTVWKKKESLV